MLEVLSWKVLPHVAYSPDLAPSDYHLFAFMTYAVTEQRFDSYNDVKKWLDEWFAAKGDDFTDVVFTKMGKMSNKRWSTL